MQQCSQCPALFVRAADLQTHSLLHRQLSALLPTAAAAATDYRLVSAGSGAAPSVSQSQSLFAATIASHLPLHCPAVVTTAPFESGPLWHDYTTTPSAPPTIPASAPAPSVAEHCWSLEGVSSPPLAVTALNLSTSHWQSEAADGAQSAVFILPSAEPIAHSLPADREVGWMSGECNREPSSSSRSSSSPSCSTSSATAHTAAPTLYPNSTHALSQQQQQQASTTELLYTDESLQSSCSSPLPLSAPTLCPLSQPLSLGGRSVSDPYANLTEQNQDRFHIANEQYQHCSFPLEALSHCILSFTTSGTSGPLLADSSGAGGSALDHPLAMTSFSNCHQRLPPPAAAAAAGGGGANVATQWTESGTLLPGNTPLLLGLDSLPPSTSHPPRLAASAASVSVATARFVCGVCAATFAHRASLVRHQNRVHSTATGGSSRLRGAQLARALRCATHTCDTCGRQFGSARRLRWHAEIHAQRPRVCGACGRRFLHQSWLTRHQRRQHPHLVAASTPTTTPAIHSTSPSADSACGKAYPGAAPGAASAGAAGALPCPVCARLYTRSSLKRHVQMVHERLQPYECGRCGRRFAAKCNLIAHQLTHLSALQRPFVCSECGSGYATARDLQRHTVGRHQRQGQQWRFTCDECGRRFSERKLLTAHMRVHSTAKHFQCSVCQRRFARKAYLSAHMRVHTGERPHTCSVCERSFASRSNYNVHVRSHSRRPPVVTEL